MYLFPHPLLPAPQYLLWTEATLVSMRIPVLKGGMTIPNDLIDPGVSREAEVKADGGGGTAVVAGRRIRCQIWPWSFFFVFYFWCFFFNGFNHGKSRLFGRIFLELNFYFLDLFFLFLVIFCGLYQGLNHHLTKAHHFGRRFLLHFFQAKISVFGQINLIPQRHGW